MYRIVCTMKLLFHVLTQNLYGMKLLSIIMVITTDVESHSVTRLKTLNDRDSERCNSSNILLSLSPRFSRFHV